MINIIHGDITTIPVDAIVNAAHASLKAGGGVDGAIHRIGGDDIQKDCRRIIDEIGYLPTGDAVITTAGNLPAKYVIHTVGAIWNGGNDDECELLKNSYENCLSLALENNVKSISFPNISTGIHKFPKKLAMEISMEVINKYIDKFDIINIVCYDIENYELYMSHYNEILLR